jgi:hypothetical protein
MSVLLLAAALPALLWDGNPDAPELARHGIERVVKTEQTVGARKAAPPGIRPRAGEASATRLVWIDANGWRFERERGRRATWLYEVPREKAALAMAEAFAWDADAVFKLDPSGLDVFGRALAFLRNYASDSLPGVADVGVVDNGAPATGELMNLLARKNLLFRVVAEPSAGLPVVVDTRSRETRPANPVEHAEAIRQKLGDEKRSFRIYGASSILGRLTAEGGRARLHLINYGQRSIDAVRVRVRGQWKRIDVGMLDAMGEGKLVDPEDVEASSGFTEFTIPNFSVYAIVELAE